MKVEITVALISLTGILISALVSWFIARQSSKFELKKMITAWEHDNKLNTEKELAQMVEAVNIFLSYPCGQTQNDAIAKVSSYRTKERGNLASLLDGLIVEIRASKNEEFYYGGSKLSFNLAPVQEYLTKILAEIESEK